MSSSSDKKKRATRSLVLVMLAWVFIGGQGLLAAGSVYNHKASTTSQDQEAVESAVAWNLISQGADRMRVVAVQAQPDVIGNVAIFLAVVNALGLAALALGLLSWSRSKHTSGKITIAVAMTMILVNSLLNLPYA